MKQKLATNSINVRSVTLLKKKVKEDLTVKVALPITKESWYAQHQAASTFWATIISALALAFSVNVLYVTREDTKANLLEMQRQNQISLRVFDSSLESGRKDFAYQDSINKIQLQNLKDQLAQAKTQFEVENRSKLKIDMIRTNQLSSQTPFVIDYDVLALGKVPIEVTQSYSVLYVDSVFQQKPFLLYKRTGRLNTHINLSMLVSESKAHSTSYTSLLRLTNEEIASIRSGKTYLFFAIQIDYIDPLKRSKKRYFYNARFDEVELSSKVSFVDRTLSI